MKKTLNILFISLLIGFICEVNASVNGNSSIMRQDVSQNYKNTKDVAATITKKIFSSDDTYVYGRGGNEATIIRGLDDVDFLKTYYNSSRTWAYETFLKFDLSQINNNTDLIKNVKLKLYGNDNNNDKHAIQVFQVSGSNWNEDDLSYSTLSSTGTKTKITSMESNMGTPQWYEWDVTELIKSSKLSGVNKLVIMLCDSITMKKPDGATSVIASFHSKENPSGNAPYLEVIEEDYSALVLEHINIDGVDLNGFQPYKLFYKLSLSSNVTDVPKVTAIAANQQSNVQITPATSLTGTEKERTTEIKVSADGQTLTYSIVFEVMSLNNNANVSSISIDAGKLEFFGSNVYHYTYHLPYTHNQQSIPLVSCIEENPNQSITITPANSLSGSKQDRTTTITVQSGDKTKTNTYNITFEILPELDLFFCIGQSNMAGRGYMDESQGDLNPIDNCYLFTPELNWEIASNPLNKYSSVRKELSVQRISPAFGFATSIAKKTSKQIGLVVNARGGSSIAEWTKGGSVGLYEEALIRAKEAQKWGKIKAILWHQGESNSNATAVTSYPTSLKKMVDNFRADLDEPDLYFVAGELAYWRGGGTGSNAFNQMIKAISGFISNSDYVSAEGLTPLIDNSDPHFDRESNMKLGLRYAEKVSQKIYGISGIAEIAISKQDTIKKVYVDEKQLLVKNETGNTQLEVFSMTGQLIESKLIHSDVCLELPSSGLYIVKLIIDSLNKKQ